MPQPSKIPLAFAASGDKNIIPESTETTGLASWRDGFPAITSTPFAEGGIAPKRADFNGIFNALSAAALWYQQGGVFVYDNATNYEIGNIVIYSGEIYVCKTANGPASALHSPANDTAETYWGRIYPQNGTFNRMFFSQTSGNFVAPRTGVYRITLKGGGGGGAGAQTASFVSGGGGGEGTTICFYTSLTRGVAYPYVIGAGGSAGADVSEGNSNAGGDGGISSITINNVTTSVRGGGGAPRATLHDSLGGVPGLTVNNAPSNSIIWGGSAGMSGGKGTAALPYEYTFGGGATGYQASPNRSPINGAGGCGSGRLMQAQDGAAGFILIEYAG